LSGRGNVREGTCPRGEMSRENVLYLHKCGAVGRRRLLESARRSLQLTPMTMSVPQFHILQEARLSQRDRAMLHVTEYFAKSLKITEYRTTGKLPIRLP